jgi:putative transposase
LGMNEKYKNKYRIASARAAWWDYGWAGAYFIAIITRNRVHCFGNIKNQCMILSPVGVLANVFWHEIPNHAPNVDLGAFVVMPDHFHGILILSPPDSVVETRHALPLQKPAENRFQNQGKTRFHLWSVPINRRLHGMQIALVWNLLGNPDFMTISFKTMQNTNE